MVVIGAKGFASELLELLTVEMHLDNSTILLFDNLNKNLPPYLFNCFKLLRSYEEVKEYFQTVDKEFTLGLGIPERRRFLAEAFEEMGGVLTTIISSRASVGTFCTTIGKGSQIMQGAIITNNVSIGKGVLVNLNSTISHDTVIGDYTEIACGVAIAGRCTIGDNVFIGMNASINPNISIGDNSIIGSGAVIINDVPANVTIVGNPGKIIKKNE